MASGLLNSGPLSMNLSPAALLQQQLPQSSPPEQMSEEDKFQERKRDILVLVMRFLADYGYLVTYQSLCVEASMTLDQVRTRPAVTLLHLAAGCMGCLQDHKFCTAACICGTVYVMSSLQAVYRPVMCLWCVPCTCCCRLTRQTT